METRHQRVSTIPTDTIIAGLRSGYGYRRQLMIEQVKCLREVKPLIWIMIEEMAHTDEMDFVRQSAHEALAGRVVA